jgi:hypothetical protein
MTEEKAARTSGPVRMISTISKEPIVFTHLLREIQGKDDQKMLSPIQQ